MSEPSCAAGQARARTRAITDRAGLEQLAPEWSGLAAADGNVFCTPEWLGSWMRHYGDVCRPHVIVASGDDGGCEGLLPLVASGEGTRTRLGFPGAALADRFHPLAHPGRRRAVARRAAELLTQDAGDWGILTLDSVAEHEPWVAELVGLARGRLRHVETGREMNPCLVPSGLTWEELLATRSASLRRELGRDLRALRRGHEVVFRRTEWAEDLDRDVDSFLRLLHRRWEARGGAPVLAGSRSRAFFRDFAATALERGWLRLWLLCIDRRPVAAQCSWHCNGRHATYLPAFDPAFSKHSVGLLLLAHALRAAIEEGAEEIDLGKGGQPYKWRFASAGRPVKSVVIAHSLAVPAVAVLGRAHLRNGARRLPPGVRRRLRQKRDPLLTHGVL